MNSNNDNSGQAFPPPPRMRAKELVNEMYCRTWEEDDGSDADLCFAVCEQFLDWLMAQGWSAAPTAQTPAQPRQQPQAQSRSAQHTPGPWAVQDIGANCLQITAIMQLEHVSHNLLAYYSSIATVTQRDAHPRYDVGISRQTCAANARLIAAAPDFYEACKALIAYCDKNPPMGESLWSVQLIRAAIAKAEGGAAIQKAEGK